jgi:hypothetical protein
MTYANPAASWEYTGFYSIKFRNPEIVFLLASKWKGLSADQNTIIIPAGTVKYTLGGGLKFTFGLTPLTDFEEKDIESVYGAHGQLLSRADG